ncbi:MAG: ISAzo13 family transposase [Alkalinema sp. RU_4_3]|nr:ISAzo13 family transposase [Alkalinema sp. RU_4_3]
MSNFPGIARIRSKYKLLEPYLNEKTRRIWPAAESTALGRGGVSQVSAATGISRTTIYSGMRDLNIGSGEVAVESDGIRHPGGGRKRLTELDPTLSQDLQALVEASTRGDPESPLQWTCKSTSHLAKALGELGHEVSERSVCTLLHSMGYSLQANRKTHEGKQHEDRDQQFRHIAKQVKAFHQRHQPVISVDAKKKELVGNYKNAGQEWHAKGQPEMVNVYDFPDKVQGKALPYGVYDLQQNQGWVSVGISHDTAELATETIRRWWDEMGKPLYPEASELLITADCGGSNGNRVRLWKLKLQELADTLGLRIQVCHFPPGTSKWNKIEHRMFCHISQNWRGRPLKSRSIIVNLISHTTTKQGLKIRVKLDKHDYKTGIKVGETEFSTIVLEKDKFHGEWNYRIHPREGV